MTKEEFYKLTDILNSMFEESVEHSNILEQEEPVSEELEEEIDNYVKRNGYDGLDSIEEVKYIAQYFAKWQKGKDEYITEDLGEYINELSKQFPEVSFAKLSRIAVRVAKWQKEKDKKEWLDKALDFFGSDFNSLVDGGVIGAFDDKEKMIEEFVEFMNDDNL